MLQRFLAEYAALGLTNTEACFILHHLDLGDVPVSAMAIRMNMSESGVRAIARSLEAKRLIRRRAQLGDHNIIELTGALQWISNNYLEPEDSPRPVCG